MQSPTTFLLTRVSGLTVPTPDGGQAFKPTTNNRNLSTWIFVNDAGPLNGELNVPLHLRHYRDSALSVDGGLLGVSFPSSYLVIKKVYLMEYEELSYEGKAKEAFRRMRILPIQDQIEFLAITLELEHELGDRECIQRHLLELSNE